MISYILVIVFYCIKYCIPPPPLSIECKLGIVLSLMTAVEPSFTPVGGINRFFCLVSSFNEKINPILTLFRQWWRQSDCHKSSRGRYNFQWREYMGRMRAFFSFFCILDTITITWISERFRSILPHSASLGKILMLGHRVCNNYIKVHALNL